MAGPGAELLEGPVLRGAPAFESWLLSERRRLASATESVLHEAALGLLARGELDRARGFAVRAAAMSPLDENHQALVIRLYRLSGDDDAAERQYGAFAALLDAELGVGPGAGGRGGPARTAARRRRGHHGPRGRGGHRGGLGGHRGRRDRPRHHLAAQRGAARRRGRRDAPAGASRGSPWPRR